MESLTRVCLDTDILIDYMRKPSDATQRIMNAALNRKLSICTTSINTFEILLGAHLHPKPAQIIEDTEDFLNQLEIINFDYETSFEASRIMAHLRQRGQIIEIRDLFVACICKINNFLLVTRNLKHYKRVPGLRVMTPQQAAIKTQA